VTARVWAIVVDVNEATAGADEVDRDQLGCIIYNSSQGNKAIAVFDFGGTKSSTNGDFTIVFPTADASNAILRLA
jgi:hypothetical protein